MFIELTNAISTGRREDRDIVEVLPLV